MLEKPNYVFKSRMALNNYIFTLKIRMLNKFKRFKCSVPHLMVTDIKNNIHKIENLVKGYLLFEDAQFL